MRPRGQAPPVAEPHPDTVAGSMAGRGAPASVDCKHQQLDAPAGNPIRHETLEGQLQAFDEHSGEARQLAAHLLENHWNAIRDEARSRLIAGWQEFGYSGWEKSIDELWEEGGQEGSDWIVYNVMLYERRQREGL